MLNYTTAKKTGELTKKKNSTGLFRKNAGFSDPLNFIEKYNNIIA